MPSVCLKDRFLTVSEIEKATGGRIMHFGNALDEERILEVAIDSRDAGVGALFCAIPGEKTDGYKYIPSAVKNGCKVVLCQREPSFEEDLSFTAVVVEDTVKAMGRLARYYRSGFAMKVIGVTGSVGKTTTKEMIAAVCREKFVTHKTEGNYNSVIGLPLTLFSMSQDTQVAVLEMGMSNFGEIEQMSLTARPDFAVITTIGTAHMEYLGSREGICRAKMEITAGMTPGESKLLLLGSEPLLCAQQSHPLQPLFFTVEPMAGDIEPFIHAENIQPKGEGLQFDAVFADGRMKDIELPMKGKHNVGDALSAIAIGRMLGVEEDKIRHALRNYVPVGMRQRIGKLGNMDLIEDCYNANPESMRAGLELLKEMAADKKRPAVALLGDMLELGENSPEYHRQVGRAAVACGVSALFCFGPLSKRIREGALAAGMAPEAIRVWDDPTHPEAMASLMREWLTKDAVLLVKASRGIAAEKVIEELRKYLTEEETH